MNHTIRKLAIGTLVFALAIVCLVPALNAHAAKTTYTFAYDNSTHGIRLNSSTMQFQEITYHYLESAGTYSLETKTVPLSPRDTVLGWCQALPSYEELKYKQNSWGAFSVWTNGYYHYLQMAGLIESDKIKSGHYVVSQGYNESNRRRLSNSTCYDVISSTPVTVYIELRVPEMEKTNVANGGKITAMSVTVATDATGGKIAICDKNKKAITTAENIKNQQNYTYTLQGGNTYYVRIEGIKGTKHIGIIPSGHGEGTKILGSIENPTKAKATTMLKTSAPNATAIAEPINAYDYRNWYQFKASNTKTTLTLDGYVESSSIKITVYDAKNKTVISKTYSGDISQKALSFATTKDAIYYVKVERTSVNSNGCMSVTYK